MRVLVTGSRYWTNKDRIRRVLSAFKDVECIIEGEARGADTLAREVAEELGIPVDPYPADWDRFHKAAGPIRNRQMVNEGKPDIVVAFHNNILGSKGTKDMVTFAWSKHIPTFIYTETGTYEGKEI